ncbi:hypothetical protein BUALT_Bualt10G0051300 [Buddleja alternifolia]|uniref:Potassium transporter n=1 Tax=Buddleja alternifolia TaxID=168488 RepID=A0AAV6WXN3_9LAMI|nr:hypothetical protein BUALT_Bualt10G0051300 [Buddleja alternifolia]
MSSKERNGNGYTPDVESDKPRHHRHGLSKPGQWMIVLNLALQSIGVVYGDIGTSPLYVFASTFSNGVQHNDDILGVLSLILYTLTLIPLIKYVFVVLRANDKGHGGTFALYSLICRHAKVGLIPQEGDEDVSSSDRASKLKSKLENSKFVKFGLLLATMFGTSMVIGDGVLTPCISVLSAVGGLKEATSIMNEDRIVWASVAILIVLFMVQRLGTNKVGYLFAPIIGAWFLLIAGIGVYNLIKYDPTVLKAVNPKYIIDYFKRNKDQAWMSLGGVVLAITGAEALFADVGHFSVRSIQLSMCVVTYPALVLAYIGQASFLRKNNNLVSDTFYKSLPGPMFWPMFVLAVLASIIASQAMISGTFSVIQQSLSHGCFPRVKLVHTSTKHEGQIYIPEVNYLLMVACVFVTLGFRTTEKIGNAYGIAIVFVMTLTSVFLVLIMIIIWRTHIVLVLAYVMIIGTVELFYLSSVLYKFNQGGYLPLAISTVLVTIMCVWNNVHRKKYFFELDHMILPEQVQEIIKETNTQRVPGLAIFYSDLVNGIAPIFRPYLENVRALHSVVVFVSLKSLPISKVPKEERFFFGRVQPENLLAFICIVHYGFMDADDEQEPFETLLIQRLKEFLRKDHHLSSTLMRNGTNLVLGTSESIEVEAQVGNDDNIVEEVDIPSHNEDETDDEEENIQAGNLDDNDEQEGVQIDNADQIVEEEASTDEDKVETHMDILDKAVECGVIHLVGEHKVVAKIGSNLGKRL